MKIAVCLKQILDPELPAKAFDIDVQQKKPVYGEHPLVINPFDENALEMALQIKDNLAGCQVTALTMGGFSSEEVLRKALALKVDAAIRIAVDENNTSSHKVAQCLGERLKQNESFDIILFGRQAGDWEQGQVGGMVAEHLKVPNINNIFKIEVVNGSKIIFWRDMDGEIQLVEGKAPVVVTTTNSPENVPRMAKVKDIMQAYNKEIIEVPYLEPQEMQKGSLKIVELRKPEKKVQCEFLEGNTEEELSEILINKLHVLGLLK